MMTLETITRVLPAVAAALLGCQLAGPVLAQESGSDEQTRILVTFEDPGMSNAARAGPARPGYSRRSASYLVSLPVKRAARRIAADFDFELVDDWPIMPLKVFCQVYAVGGGRDIDALLEALRQRPEVESAQRLNRFRVSGEPASDIVDPYVGLQHNLETLEVGAAHAWTRGDGVLVTVIDTGADIHHPDLETQVHDHRDFVADDGRFMTDAHGTAIVGIISASSDNGIGIVGIAPSARIDVLKACWYAAGEMHAVCDTFTLAKAISHAIESDTDIINLSLGGPHDPLLGRLVASALARGILVVAAAPATATPGFPADVPGVIVVGAAPPPHGSAKARSAMSRPAMTNLLNAPGEEILVPVPGGGFDYASGSSLSAAQVSGIGALLRSLRPGISQDEVRRLLADSRPSADESVNACKALARLLSAAAGCRNAVTTARSF